MATKAKIGLKMWSSLALALILVSCSSESPPAASPPPTDERIASAPPKPSASGRFPGMADIREVPATGEAPEVHSASPSAEEKLAPPAVEASAVHPREEEAAEPEKPPEATAFQPQSPSLAGIRLDMPAKEIVDRLGSAKDTYRLPGDERTIEIWEYEGLSVGLNDRNRVAYVEISSSEVNTEIKGMQLGIDGALAADLLGLEADERTNVLTAEVSGGWLKLDLDPDTRKVLSIRLLNGEME
ncbi:hypothetical protein ACF3MZ_04015 [Paenibacillaceae bacterium WGS1546]|uniref:hypothetical protein n=1 Tax=Cohnella sp. WGS1546 TaxID=3366810 RepID=UPI00372CEA59